MGTQNILKDYLRFSKKDRIGLICIIALVLLIYILPRVFTKDATRFSLQTDSVLLKAIDTVNKTPITPHNETPGAQTQYRSASLKTNQWATTELFEFDPNTLTADGWKRLGLNERIVKTLINYRNKGGKFRKPEDVKKIWGLPDEFYERVKDFIRLSPPSNSLTVATFSPKTEKPERKIVEVNINEADTSAFIALPGIGSKLASRIINFREKLGGFHSIEQVGETYGLPDSTFQKLKPFFKINPSEIKKLNINLAGKEELKAHPYIRWNLANAIVEYRNQHGNFSSLEDLKKIALIDETVFEKIAPYLTL